MTYVSIVKSRHGKPDHLGGKEIGLGHVAITASLSSLALSMQPALRDIIFACTQSLTRASTTPRHRKTGKKQQEQRKESTYQHH
jgi:hypothetical protein